MAPISRLHFDETLPPGQMTIFSALNGSLAVAQPPLPLRLGPKPKSTGQAGTVLGRRLVGGQNEKQNVELFANTQLAQDRPERRDEDIVRGVIDEDETDDTNDEYIPKHQHKYS
jgi:hypothetical protein